jgi:hypothetical protein
VRALSRLPARPPAGAFRVLEAVGSRRSAAFEVTTRHRFTAAAIEESWTVRRRRGRGYASVALRIPSWGARTRPRAVLDDGRAVVVGQRPLALDRVRGFRLPGLAITLDRPARGTVRAVPALPQSTNPRPGATLVLAVAAGTAFKRVRLDARLVPRGSS